MKLLHCKKGLGAIDLVRTHRWGFLKSVHSTYSYVVTMSFSLQGGGQKGSSNQCPMAYVKWNVPKLLYGCRQEDRTRKDWQVERTKITLYKSDSVGLYVSSMGRKPSVGRFPSPKWGSSPFCS